MIYKLTDEDRKALQEARAIISEVIGRRYPEPNDFSDAHDTDFKWGIGDGFRLALGGLLKAAFPDW